jgi:Diacylglycerol kinase catalytic domain
VSDPQAGATLRPCLLVNPRSFRSSWMGLAGRASRQARAAGLEVHDVVDPPSLHARLEELRARRVRQIWILAGDGTIHALAEYVAEWAHDWSPALLLLAGGRANVVPRECGGYPAMPALRRALDALHAGRPLPEQRMPVLQVSQQGMPVRHGFVFGGALVYEAVRLAAEHRAAGSTWRHRSWFADPYIYLRWIVRTLVLRRPLPPFPEVAARLAGVGELTGPLRALVATTLEMRNALYNPFAARGSGPVRLTAILTTAPSIWRMLPALLKGRFTAGMDPAHGVLSGRGERAELRGIASYVLDGEIFAADPALPLEFAPGPPLRVLRP